MNLEELKKRKIAILGFSVEGLAVARFLGRQGIAFTILEKNAPEKLLTEAQAYLKDFRGRFVTGLDHLKPLTEFDLISRSQGIPLWLPELIEAKKRGAEITSMTKLFFDFCSCPIIGVTGTKGKGTTATLIYEMLKASNQDVYLGGNIGTPPLDFLDDLRAHSKVVLELSSFQLEDLTKSPHLAVVLMVTSDHLNSQASDSPNYHQSLKDYLEAKKNIVRFQSESDRAIFNDDFENSRAIGLSSRGQALPFSLKEKFSEGAYLEGDWLMVCLNKTCFRLCRRDEVFLRGEHNLQNILAAASASLLSGAKLEKVSEVIKTFRGLEHRLELVREINGVKYYNDSFSTTPETAIAAIKSFSEPEILILGGSEKGSDYSELGRTIAEARNIRAVILIGATAPKIKEAIGTVLILGTVPKNRFVLDLLGSAGSMEQIVLQAAEFSQPSDVVVLSPACASFDMFKNYKDRGNQFREAVLAL